MNLLLKSFANRRQFILVIALIAALAVMLDAPARAQRFARHLDFVRMERKARHHARR